MTNFCTNCGNKLEKNDLFCTNCGTKRYDDNETKVQQRFLELTKSGHSNNYFFKQNLKKHNLTTTEGENIKKQIVKEIDNETLKPDEVENRIKELTIEYENNKIFHAKHKLKFLEEYVETDEIKSKIKDYEISEKQLLNFIEELKKKIILNAFGNYNEDSIKNDFNIYLNRSHKEVLLKKTNELKNNKLKYVEEKIKETCPNMETTSFEKKVIQSIILEGSFNEMKKILNIISEKLIDNRKKFGKIDCAGILIEDGGFINTDPKFFEKQNTRHILKAENIKTDVLIKIDEDRIFLVECKFSDYLSLNSLERKRMHFFNDIVFMKKGYKEFKEVWSIFNTYSEPKSHFNYNDHGIEISFINKEKIILLFDDNDKEELLYNKWIKYKENNINTSSQKSNNVGEDILKYAELYEKGLLTEEEFTALKKKLLGL